MSDQNAVQGQNLTIADTIPGYYQQGQYAQSQQRQLPPVDYNAQNLRIKALELAVGNFYDKKLAPEIVEAALKFYNFLQGSFAE